VKQEADKYYFCGHQSGFF